MTYCLYHENIKFWGAVYKVIYNFKEYQQHLRYFQFLVRLELHMPYSIEHQQQTLEEGEDEAQKGNNIKKFEVQ